MQESGGQERIKKDKIGPPCKNSSFQVKHACKCMMTGIKMFRIHAKNYALYSHQSMSEPSSNEDCAWKLAPPIQQGVEEIHK